MFFRVLQFSFQRTYTSLIVRYLKQKLIRVDNFLQFYPYYCCRDYDIFFRKGLLFKHTFTVCLYHYIEKTFFLKLSIAFWRDDDIRGYISSKNQWKIQLCYLCVVAISWTIMNPFFLFADLLSWNLLCIPTPFNRLVSNYLTHSCWFNLKLNPRSPFQ